MKLPRTYPTCDRCGGEINPHKYDDSDRCYISDKETLCKGCFVEQVTGQLELDPDRFAQLLGADIVYLEDGP